MTNTYFIDLDGTIFQWFEDFSQAGEYEYIPPKIGAVETLYEWHCQGHMIIIVTARPETMREITEKQLKNANIIYDRMIMGVGSGPRNIINDYDPIKHKKANAINVDRFNSYFLDEAYDSRYYVKFSGMEGDE